MHADTRPTEHFSVFRELNAGALVHLLVCSLLRDEPLLTVTQHLSHNASLACSQQPWLAPFADKHSDHAKLEEAIRAGCLRRARMQGRGEGEGVPNHILRRTRQESSPTGGVVWCGVVDSGLWAPKFGKKIIIIKQ